MDEGARTAASSCVQLSKLARMRPEDKESDLQIKTAFQASRAFIKLCSFLLLISAAVAPPKLQFVDFFLLLEVKVLV